MSSRSRREIALIELLRRLPAVGLLRADSATRARIVRDAAPTRGRRGHR